MEWH
jgi:hypothetical protein